MKPTATGRILFWRHGSLWIGRAGDPTGFHAHHAVQISLPFPGNRVQLRQPSAGWRSYAAAIVTANQPHAFDAQEQYVAQIFLDPESRAGRALQTGYQAKGIGTLDIAALMPLIAKLATAYQQQAVDEALLVLAREVVETLAGATDKPAKLPDERIALAVELMRGHLGEAIALSTIAATVHLSPDRFRHLFMEETGVGFRAYLLWLRLECALTTYVAGSTLTEAAYAGGFADSAHFSRTFRRMFGIAPASVRLE